MVYNPFKLLYYRYIKAKRNRVPDIRLVAWKISGSNSQESNQDNNYKTNVPIYATLIGTFGTLIVVTLCCLVFTYFTEKSDESSKGGPYSVFIIISAIHLPLVLALTISHHRKTNQVAPLVPTTLQFHEENEKSPSEKSRSPSPETSQREINVSKEAEKSKGILGEPGIQSSGKTIFIT